MERLIEEFLRAMCGKNRFDRVINDWVMNGCGVAENVFNKYETCVLRWFGHVERIGDERISKQVHNDRVNKRRMKGRRKKDMAERCPKVPGECKYEKY
jgi:hypothetical protein